MALRGSEYSNIVVSGNSRVHNGNVINYGTAPEQAVERSRNNHHYATRILVDSYYTGRKEEAENLAKWMIHSPERSQKQVRFVVCGIGGSGKTQFCCKFAESNRDHFWGIFWIDGRSERDLKRTLSEVAKIGGVDTNVKAARTWLTNLDESWLLIIDNADDPAVNLEDYIPGGDRGHVLITTRNTEHTKLGNVGTGFFTFDSLRQDEAEKLLLVASRQKEPHSEDVKQAAEKISEALGHLALAIAVAAGSIRKGWCTLDNYLDFHKKQTKLAWSRRKRRASTDTAESEISKYESVEAAFDVSYTAFEEMKTDEAQDALHVLRVLAYLHCVDIRFDFIRRAITNAANDLHQQAPTLPLRWSDIFFPDIGKLYTCLHRRWSRPILPDVFSETQLEDDPNLFRITKALGLLTSASLISHNEISDTYSMHILLHSWARRVPGIGLAEQAAWAECAATLLANCILLPSPSESDKKSEEQTDEEAMRATVQKRQEELKGREELRKQLLPHVDHVRDRQSEIRELMSKSRQNCKWFRVLRFWQDLNGVISRDRALMFAKFSIVYLEHGRFSEAEHLQTAVMEYTMRYLGPQHESTRRITLLLADTYVHTSQPDRAEELQNIVIDACTSRYDKLVAQQKLAESRRLQGHLTDARNILTEVVTGLTEDLGESHEDTLDAIDALGRALHAFYDDQLYLDARELHRKAYNGIRRIHGDDAIKTLLFCENLCMTAVSTCDPGHLREAHDMMERILETRRDKLGREHAYTLLAMVNLARVQSCMDDLKTAEKHILHGLPIAKRNLGEDHFAYLWARYELAKVMMKQFRWHEAKELLENNIGRQKKIFEKRDGHHPDVVGGLIELATVFNALGMHLECERIVGEALQSLERLSSVTNEHPLATKLKANRDEWRRTRNGPDAVLGAIEPG